MFLVARKKISLACLSVSDDVPSGVIGLAMCLFDSFKATYLPFESDSGISSTRSVCHSLVVRWTLHSSAFSLISLLRSLDEFR